MHNIFATLILALVCCCAVAQTTSDTYIEGQFAVTTNTKAVFVNIGGATIKWIGKKINVSIMMGPSIKFETENNLLMAVPVLGVGPQLYLLKDKRFILSFPSYYISSKKIWLFSAGIGYLLTKPK